MHKFNLSDEICDFKVWELRRVKVLEFINKIRKKSLFKINRVLDIGCGEGKLLTYLLTLDLGIKQLVGVDINIDSLEKAKSDINKVVRNLNMERKIYKDLDVKECNNIVLDLYLTNLLEKNSIFRQQFLNFDLITFIEVIEHLYLPDAENCLDILLGYYRPKFLILTTPNKDYNVMFGMNDTQVRNYDHKFEWTKREFESICNKFSIKYNYDIQFDGVGYFNNSLGHSTQICYFSRKSKAYFKLIQSNKTSGKLVSFYNIKYKPKTKRKLKLGEIAFQIINAYYFHQIKGSCIDDYVGIKLIYAYNGIQKIFKSFNQFTKILFKFKFYLNNLGIDICIQKGIQYTYPESTEDC